MSTGGRGRTGPAFASGPLLERERELELLAAVVDAAVSGSAASLVLVEGPAGIGKSRLLAETRRMASIRELLVLSARGGELERDFPFGIVRQLFESHLVEASAGSPLLSGAAATAGHVFGLPGDGGEQGGEGTFATLHGLYWLTVNLSTERPLLLAVDDLHWCDRASLRFLAYLARRLEDLPVAVVGSLRPSEPAADQALLAELTSDPSAHVLIPGVLSPRAVDELVRERLGDGVAAAFTHECHTSTGGNPLLLSELIKAVVAEQVPPDAAHVDVVADLGPKAASRAVLLRLARLSSDAVEVARAIAVLGDGPDVAVVAALTGLEPAGVAAATRELIRAEILRSEAPLGFVHPLVRAAVYRDLAPAERELAHERAANLLAALHAPVEQIAAQALAMPARGADWVVDVLRRAASEALARGDPDAAISLLLRALDEPPPAESRFELLLELGNAETLTSLATASEHLRSAFELAPAAEPRARAADGLARTLLFMAEPEDAAKLTQRVAQELPAELEDLSLRLEALELHAPFFGADMTEDRLRRLRAYRATDPARGIGAKMIAAIAAWAWAESAGPWQDVCALARGALAGGELMAADSGLTTVVATLPLALADLDEAVERWDLLRAEAHRVGSSFTISGVQLWGGMTHYLRGDLAEAESELRASLETLSFWGIPTQSQWTIAFLAEVLVERGGLEEARRLLDVAVYPPATSDHANLLTRAHLNVLLAEGRPEAALELVDQYARDVAWKCHPRHVPWRSLKAQALDRVGRQDEAVALAREELEIARGWGSPGTVGRSLRVLGTVEREQGVDHLLEARAVLEHAPARLEHAKTLAALGSTLRRARRPTEAREPLRRALELAEVCGAQPLVEEVRAEIYATGARPRTAALHGVGALTASERRVVDLAADGQTNRDIAQTLYVTPKTVEVHLSNAYRKLGIGSRRELARVLRDAA